MTALLESFDQLTTPETLLLRRLRSAPTALEAPESFGQLTALKTLLRDQTQRTARPESFSQLTALETRVLHAAAR